MATTETTMQRVAVLGEDIEYAWFGPAASDAPKLVFLHEGLGCVEMWRDGEFGKSSIVSPTPATLSET